MAADKNHSRNIRAHSGDARGRPLPRSFCTIAVKVMPNAPRHEVVGWLGETLKIKIHAPPVEGRANDALCEFLADTFSLPRRAVSLLRGETSRQKTVRLEGITIEEVRHFLGESQ